MTNSRFEDLERRCFRLKRARIIKIVFACVSVTIVALGSFYATHEPKHVLTQETIQPAQPTNDGVVVQDKNVSVPLEIQKEETATASSSAQSQEALSHQGENTKPLEGDNAYDTLMLSAKVKHDSKKGTLPKEEKIDLREPVIKIPIEDFLAMPEEKKTLNIAVKSLSDEEALLKNFQSSNTFATAIALAQFYFDKKEYIKAISWAKESSKLEPVSDKPWIIYAKSKFHLGERAEAIRSLELFVGYVNSKEAKELLTFYKGQQ